jgi:predicted lipoprotein with Yx(FWY)xxD motif
VTTRRITVAAAAVIALGLVLAACGSSSNKASTKSDTTTTTSASTTSGGYYHKSSSATSTPPSTAAGGGGAAAAATISLADNATVGKKIIVDGHGMTLYMLATEQGTTSMCTGGCATAWPAATSASAPTAGAGLDQAKLGTATGQVANQLTYNGHLLYHFAGDKAAGDATGLAVPNWFTVGADGNMIAKA